jgi:hypothetical protein
MWHHVLLHLMDQMSYDQDLNLVHDVYYILKLIE